MRFSLYCLQSATEAPVSLTVEINEKYTYFLTTNHRWNKLLQRLLKCLINAFVIFVDVYYFNKRYTKC